MGILGQLAALDTYDPDAVFPARGGNDVAAASEAAAARLARGVRRPSEWSDATTDRISSGLLGAARGFLPYIEKMGAYAEANVAKPGPMTEEEAFRINQAGGKIGEGVGEYITQNLVSRLPFAAITQGELRGGTLYANPRNRRPIYTTETAPPAPNPRAVMGGNQPPGPMARYAEEYPPVGPPVLTYDKVKKEDYLAKALTPEAEAFYKAREKIMKDMDKRGYTPMFDPDERYHVDPSNYPPNVDTQDIVPAKQETIDKHMENIGSEESRERLRAAYQRGTELPNTDRWYAMGQLEKAFIDELGETEGRKAFQNNIGTAMAATTGGADPRSNWLMAAYGNYLRANKLPLPEASHQYPTPIGGRYARNNMEMYQKVFEQGGFPGLGEANPKRHNFSQNFTGNQAVPTMDEQMTSGMTPGIQMPPKGQYGLYQAVLADEAARIGVTPQEYQAIAWSGFKNMKEPKYTRGKPFIETINESIERTSRLTGMSPQEVLRRGVIKGEIPMYALMGAIGLGSLGKQFGSLADQSKYEQ